MNQNEHLKERIIEFLTMRGADLVGFASVSRWDEWDEVRPEFRPGRLFPQAKSVIVFGMGMPLPVVETTPSSIHMELYNTVNRELDGLAYHLTRFLGRNGSAAYSFPRDGYGHIRIIKEKPRAAFSHVYAAKYAGLGSIGMNNVLLTPEFGPRVRWVSVFTDQELSGKEVMTTELCIRCQACVRCCPVDALSPRNDRTKPDFDSLKCAQRAEDLTRRRSYPCGICIKVCPVGEDRKLYQAERKMAIYLNEENADAKENPEYEIWNHFRQWGSWTEEEIKKNE